MKKILIILTIITLLFTVNKTYATDACDKLIERQQSFVWEISSAVNIRSYPCTYKSYIIKVWQPLEKYEVLAQVDWYYKIKIDNNTYWRVWDQLIKKSDEKIIKVYSLTQRDKELIDEFVEKIKNKSNETWFDYRDKIVKKISILIWKYEKWSKFSEILKELNKKLKQLSFKKHANNHYSQYRLNISKLKNHWLNWHNTERNKLGLKDYSSDLRLENTAYEWSQTCKEKWSVDHKRYLYSWYYNYKDIEKWFNERWVKCKIINRTTSSESIWYFSYHCKKNDNDCNDEALEAMEKLFNFYMSEKGKDYDPHYRSIIHNDITKIWLWIAIEKKESYDKYSDYYKMYITTHYCTEFES